MIDAGVYPTDIGEVVTIEGQDLTDEQLGEVELFIAALDSHAYANVQRRVEVGYLSFTDPALVIRTRIPVITSVKRVQSET